MYTIVISSPAKLGNDATNNSTSVIHAVRMFFSFKVQSVRKSLKTYLSEQILFFSKRKKHLIIFFNIAKFII